MTATGRRWTAGIIVLIGLVALLVSPDDANPSFYTAAAIAMPVLIVAVLLVHVLIKPDTPETAWGSGLTLYTLVVLGAAEIAALHSIAVSSVDDETVGSAAYAFAAIATALLTIGARFLQPPAWEDALPPTPAPGDRGPAIAPPKKRQPPTQ